MKRLLLFLIISSILLSACLSQTTDAVVTTETSKTDITKTPLKIEKTPTNTPTIAPTLTETKEETEAVVETQPVEEPTSTPTEQAKEAELTPTIESMFSKHPEYKDFSDSENSINKYVEAVRMTGLEISPEEVLTNLVINKFNLAETSFFVVEYKGAPLFHYINGEWFESNWKNFANMAGLRIGHTKGAAYTASWSRERIQPVLADGNIYIISDISHWRNPYEESDSLRGSPTSFDFHIMKNAVEFAKANDMVLGGNALLHANNDWLPQWLIDGTRSSSDPRAYVLDQVEKHIKGVLNGLPTMGIVAVVAEIDHPRRDVFWRKLDTPLDPTTKQDLMTELGLTENDDTTWMKHLTWMKQTYVWAQEENPDATWYYHDFDIEFGGQKADNVFNMIRALKKMGTPIHAVGFQGHFKGSDLANPTTRQNKLDALARQIQMYNENGIEVIVMEMDINMAGITNNEAERLRIQAEIQHDLVKTFLENGVRVIAHFSGIDRLSWMEDPERGGPTADPTSFGDNLQRKPNYYAEMAAILDYLSNQQ